jgi:hypothetical protein
VIEPMVEQFWHDSIVDAASEWDEATSEYLPEQLQQHSVKIDERLRRILDGERS